MISKTSESGQIIGSSIVCMEQSAVAYGYHMPVTLTIIAQSLIASTMAGGRARASAVAGRTDTLVITNGHREGVDSGHDGDW